MIIIDGHNDTLKQLFLSGRDFFSRSESGNIDLPRAREGGFSGGFFAIMVPAELPAERELGYGLTLTEESWVVQYPRPLSFQYASGFIKDVLHFVNRLTHQSGEIRIVKSFTELTACIEHNVLAMILHFEGAEAIDEDLSCLEEYYQLGLRSLGLVWSRSNVFGFGVPFKFPSTPDIGPGLTEVGKGLVRRCNELGILVDLAHINQKGFYDAASISNAPLVVSHSNAHAICPSSCNLIDAQLDLIAERNGLVGVNFDVLNSRPDGKFIIDTPFSVIIQHIDYLVSRMGIDHVALGSDFDGAQMPTNLKTVSNLPKLIDALRNHGYSRDHLEKIAYKNWLRVIKDTWH